MIRNEYFHRVHRLTPTKFWVNNPTREEARIAIDQGARGCTNNPSYSYKMLQNEDEKEHAESCLSEALKEGSNPDEIATIYQRKLVKSIGDIFYPMWKESNGVDGYVSIQGDPIHEDDPNVIIHEARENRKLGENIAIKIPCTKAGLEAMEVLMQENTPINATEIMSVQQGIDLCEIYDRISAKTGNTPPIWLSFIAGIYDEFLENYVRDNNVDIEGDIVRQAGLAATRKMYEIIHDRGYKAVIIGGGARHPRHFTEMVGGNQVVTINWKGTADKLIDENPDVVRRFQCPVPATVIDELRAKLPAFRAGWDIGGIQIDEYEDFGPVELFRSMFLSSWRKVLERIESQK